MLNHKIFDDLKKQVQNRSEKMSPSAAARWYLSLIKQHEVPSPKDLREQSITVGRKTDGALFNFFYDPKHKETLPYYDTFPLVIPFAKAKGGFLGLNFHYLRPESRLVLLQKLYEFQDREDFTKAKKLLFSWSDLKSDSKYRASRPLVKHYLFAHIRSKFIRIHPKDWGFAVMLPTEQFEKKPKTFVWKESSRIINAK